MIIQCASRFARKACATEMPAPRTLRSGGAEDEPSPAFEPLALQAQAVALPTKRAHYASAETRRDALLRRHKEMPSTSMVASQHPTLNETILPMTPPASPVWIG
jgi:hypothetical protein